MKKLTAALLFSFLAATTLSGVVSAAPDDDDSTYADADQPQRAHPGKRFRGKRRARMLHRYDANNDGVLSQTERDQMKRDREQRRAEMFDMLDTNNDGFLSKDEFMAARDVFKAKRKEWRKDHKDGKDGNGRFRGRDRSR